MAAIFTNSTHSYHSSRTFICISNADCGWAEECVCVYTCTKMKMDTSKAVLVATRKCRLMQHSQMPEKRVKLCESCDLRVDTRQTHFINSIMAEQAEPAERKRKVFCQIKSCNNFFGTLDKDQIIFR